MLCPASLLVFLRRLVGVFSFFLLSSVALVLASCDLAANYTKTDRASNMEFQDFRDGLAERLPEVDSSKDESASSLHSLPVLQPYISMTPETMHSMPLVSVSVNQAIPLRDVLFELASQAEYDLELDPNIRGAIIFTARNKPFDLVIQRISDLAGLRYKFEEQFLRIERDTPYVKTYNIDYLSFIRSNSGSVLTNISVVSGDGADTGSSYSASTESASDFWGELDLNLRQILAEEDKGILKTTTDPRISAAAINPRVHAISPLGHDSNVSIQPPDAVLRVDSLPVDVLDSDSDKVRTNDRDALPSGMTFSLNKQAGLINVYASQKAHEKVDAYLSILRRSVTAQVLVEAKIFEVNLYDEYINGIDWQLIDNGIVGGLLSSSGSSLLSSVASGGSSGLTLSPSGDVAQSYNLITGVVGNDFQALVHAISGFGTVRALASPRMTVLNNQSAVLNVATNRIFFKLDVDTETDDDGNPTGATVDSEIQSIPEGVLINVQPSINLKDRTISMLVRPTITRVVNTIDDPAVIFAAASAGITGVSSEIPEVNVQEIDTVVRVKSGQPIVMGGLLQDRISSEQEGVPILGEIPIFGSMFKSNSNSISKTELVIFLKATLLDNDASQTIHNTDKDLYKIFSGDRRPFKM